jgi:hypothetical protein
MTQDEARKILGNDFESWILWVYDSVYDGSMGPSALAEEFLTKGAELALLFHAQNQDTVDTSN